MAVRMVFAKVVRLVGEMDLMRVEWSVVLMADLKVPSMVVHLVVSMAARKGVTMVDRMVGQ